MNGDETFYASASGNMHGELVGRTFHNAELKLNPDFVVYVTRIFCVQIIDFRAVTSQEVYARSCTAGNANVNRENRESVRGHKHWTRRKNTRCLSDNVIYIEIFFIASFRAHDMYKSFLNT